MQQLAAWRDAIFFVVEKMQWPSDTSMDCTRVRSDRKTSDTMVWIRRIPSLIDQYQTKDVLKAVQNDMN